MYVLKIITPPKKTAVNIDARPWAPEFGQEAPRIGRYFHTENPPLRGKFGSAAGKLTVCYWKWQWIVDWPNYFFLEMVMFHSYVNVYQRVPKIYIFEVLDLRLENSE